mgnify:CR=1 FL=1
MEVEKLLEMLRERLESLGELREPEDLLRASLILALTVRELEGYALRARRYELFNALKQLELEERVIHATYLTIKLNGGGEEVLKSARKDLEDARSALRALISLL